uniref:Amidase domain-containing protein n=1 Tax=Physcomitrium patens TaxID=3218 RepID=A0A7I4CHU1_PHYPA
MAQNKMRPVDEVLRGKLEFKLAKVIAPKLTGWQLSLFVWSQGSFLFGKLIKSKLLRMNNLPQCLREIIISDAPMYQPEYPANQAPEIAVKNFLDESDPKERVAFALEHLPARQSHFQDDSPPFLYWKIRDYVEAYTTGRVTPTQVAERIIATVEEAKKRSPSLVYFISFLSEDVRKQATESTERYKKGTALSVLDGVPLAVKDDIDCLPHPSTAGTKWLPQVREVKEDAVSIARLRSCGMMMIGKAVMHELGMGTTGSNPHHGTARNPHDLGRYTGGSSSGPGAIVASGLCPVALGTDVGGSIRIPSSLCGNIGLKPTFGRITNEGLFCVGWSMESSGPIASSTEDALLVYAAMVGSHPTDKLHSWPLPPCVPDLNVGFQAIMGSLKLGKYSDWFNSTFEKEVAEVCNKSLNLIFETFGTETKEIILPELDEIKIAHLCTVGSEYVSGLAGYDTKLLKELSLEVQGTLGLFKEFTALDYLSSQKIRRRAMYFYMQAFESVDVIVTPTTGTTAPVISSAALTVGESDLTTVGNLMRFIIAPNFLGLPAISVPVGHDSRGLPIGLQLIGRPWQEATLFRVAAAFEVTCSAYDYHF